MSATKKYETDKHIPPLVSSKSTTHILRTLWLQLRIAKVHCYTLMLIISSLRVMKSRVSNFEQGGFRHLCTICDASKSLPEKVTLLHELCLPREIIRSKQERKGPETMAENKTPEFEPPQVGGRGSVSHSYWVGCGSKNLEKWCRRAHLYEECTPAVGCG